MRTRIQFHHVSEGMIRTDDDVVLRRPGWRARHAHKGRAPRARARQCDDDGVDVEKPRHDQLLTSSVRTRNQARARDSTSQSIFHSTACTHITIRSYERADRGR